MTSHIGTLAEKSLHAALKAHYARPDDRMEIPIEGFVIDIVRDDLLIEIQTGGFTPLKRKFSHLLESGYRVHLIHPIPVTKWIVKETADGKPLNRRRSPRRGKILDVFNQLVRIPHLLPHPGFSLEVVLTHQEEIRRNDGQGSWRRKGWSLFDHRLLDTIERTRFYSKADYLHLIPATLARPFTTRKLADALSINIRLGQKIAYTLYKAGWLTRAGKEGNAYLYRESGERTTHGKSP